LVSREGRGVCVCAFFFSTYFLDGAWLVGWYCHMGKPDFGYLQLLLLLLLLLLLKVYIEIYLNTFHRVTHHLVAFHPPPFFLLSGLLGDAADVSCMCVQRGCICIM